MVAPTSSISGHKGFTATLANPLTVEAKNASTDAYSLPPGSKRFIGNLGENENPDNRDGPTNVITCTIATINEISALASLLTPGSCLLIRLRPVSWR